MLAEAIEKIQFLTTRGLMPTSEKIDGRTYVRTANGDTVLVKPPLPAPLQVMTLQGVVDYGEGDGSELACLVESPSKVRLIDSLDEAQQRACVLEATVPSDAMKGRLGQQLRQPEFVTWVQCAFVPGVGDYAALLAVACQTKDVNERVSEDDGAAQSVTVKDGIVGSKELVTANPYRLSPRRTFAEVELAPVPFVFRVEKTANGPVFALHEADGGLWQVDAIAKIKAWLKAAGVTITIVG